MNWYTHKMSDIAVYFNDKGLNITIEPKLGETVYNQDRVPVGRVSAIIPLGENGENGWAVEMDELQGLHAK